MCKKQYDIGWLEYTLLGGPAPSMQEIVEKIYPHTWYAGMSVEAYLRVKPWEANPLQESGEWSEGFSDGDGVEPTKNTALETLCVPF